MRNTVILIFLLSTFTIGGCNNKVNDITPLKKYALNFEPGKDGYHKYNDIPSEVTNVLEYYPIDSNFKKYIALVFLKIYRYESEKHHQTYELRNGLFERNSPFVNAYYRITGDGGHDFFSASEVSILIKENPEFLKDKNIKSEMHRIDSVYNALNYE